MANCYHHLRTRYREVWWEKEAEEMLDRQYHLYAVDTGHFYSSREEYLHRMICRYRKEYRKLQSSSSKPAERLKQTEATKGDGERLIAAVGRHKLEKAKEAKEALLALLSNKVRRNEATKGRDHTRVLREDRIHDTNIISMFDSELSRAIGIRQDELTEALIVVQIYYFDLFRDLMFHGFTYKGETYRYFTSSAGQIRKKKAVFIKEALWNRIGQRMMCGLTVDAINSRGGINGNKYLAYMALANSATDPWEEFDIDRTIVVDDFETKVYGTFDFVDEQDYSITRKTDWVPIPHTDGAGMILPSLSKKNFMFRAPWMKGLLGVFDFQKFVQVKGCSPTIRDIYGKEHDIVKEDIQIIFTKSQFKMADYYDSWEEYKSCFQRYHCRAGRCSVEEDRMKNAKINYQMLQTLTDLTEEEIHLLTLRSAERIRRICNSKDTMMEFLGITPYNTHMSPFQEAVKLYPALLNDAYAKDLIRDIKNSLLKKYRSGRLEINGKYTFLLPDYYAACEYWFGHEENPKGLLGDQEVFCRLFPNHEKLDCLRSPHLYKEHAVRFNAACRQNPERSKLLGQWFLTDGLYASTHDLISKILMYDVDGDKSLVVADPDFVKIAERNMKDIVPLYYKMRKAEPTALNPDTIYTGLRAAFVGGNIGIYSNSISKIWNDEVFLHGSQAEKQEAMDCVKRLCCQNNFVIDYAKTLYKPEFPGEIKEQIAKYTNCKLPAFFEFAKDKEKSQVKERNESFVNQIYSRIPNTPLNTRGLKLDDIVYQKMMSDGKAVCSKEVSDLYDKLNTQYRHMLRRKDASAGNLPYVACKIREAFARLGYSEEQVADMLVEYLYGREKRYKQLLWFCYGTYLVNNLKRQIDVPKTRCVSCVDCGEWFEVDSKNKRTCRCRNCRQIHVRAYEKEKKQRQRRGKGGKIIEHYTGCIDPSDRTEGGAEYSHSPADL